MCVWCSLFAVLAVSLHSAVWNRGINPGGVVLAQTGKSPHFIECEPCYQEEFIHIISIANLQKQGRHLGQITLHTAFMKNVIKELKTRRGILSKRATNRATSITNSS